MLSNCKTVFTLSFADSTNNGPFTCMLRHNTESPESKKSTETIANLIIFFFFILTVSNCLWYN